IARTRRSMRSSSPASSSAGTSARAPALSGWWYRRDMPHIAAFRGTLAGASDRDPTRALYRYHQTFSLGGRPVTRRTLLCVVRLAPWSEGVIRPHEASTGAAREAELAAIKAARAHTGAVLAGYRDAATEVDRLFRKA